MRHVILGFALVVVGGGTAFAQEPSSALAVERCNIRPGEAADSREAFEALVDHIGANPQDLPGTVYGVFREVLEPNSMVTFILEVNSLGELEDFIVARIEANNSDERRGELFRAWRSHLDAESCDWSFHLRLP